MDFNPEYCYCRKISQTTCNIDYIIYYRSHFDGLIWTRRLKVESQSTNPGMES